MTLWRRPTELGDLDIAGALDATQAQIDRIARWAERLAVVGWVAAVVFTLAFSGRWIIDGGAKTAAAIIIVVLAAVPGTILHLLGGMLRGSVQDIRKAAAVVVSWARSGERDAKIERLRSASTDALAAKGRIRQIIAMLGVVRMTRDEMAEIRSISSPGRTLILSSGYLTFILATTGVAGTMLVCWMAAGMTVVRVIAELT
jgi:hypothetical protein